MKFRSDEGVAEWMRAYWERLGEKIDWPTPYVCFGVESEGELGLGVIFEGFNGEAVCMHVVCRNRKLLTRKVIRAAFEFPFETLRCKQVVGVVPSRNDASRTFCERLGFQEKRRQERFYTDGDAAVIYVMNRDQIRFLQS